MDLNLFRNHPVIARWFAHAPVAHEEALPEDHCPAAWEIEETVDTSGLIFNDLAKVAEALCVFGTAEIADSPFFQAKLWRDTIYASKHLIPSTFGRDEVNDFIEQEILRPFRNGNGAWQVYFDFPQPTAFANTFVSLRKAKSGPTRYILHLEPDGDWTAEVEVALARKLDARRLLGSFRVTRLARPSHQAPVA